MNGRIDSIKGVSYRRGKVVIRGTDSRGRYTAVHDIQTGDLIKESHMPFDDNGIGRVYMKKAAPVFIDRYRLRDI